MGERGWASKCGSGVENSATVTTTAATGSAVMINETMFKDSSEQRSSKRDMNLVRSGSGSGSGSGGGGGGGGGGESC